MIEARIHSASGSGQKKELGMEKLLVKYGDLSIEAQGISIWISIAIIVALVGVAIFCFRFSSTKHFD